MTTIAQVNINEKTVKEAYHCATLLDEWQEERNTFGQEAVKWETQSPLDDKTTYKVSYALPTEESVSKAKPPPCFCAEAPRALLFYHGDFTIPSSSHVTISEMSYTNPGIHMNTNTEILDSNEQNARKAKVNELYRSLGLTGAQTKASENSHQSENGVTEQERHFIRTLRSSLPLNLHYSNVNSEDKLTTNSCDKNTCKKSTNKNSNTYIPPSIPPIGRVATRDRLLTTKQITIDATGIHATTHADTSYPLTSSVCIGPCMKSKDNPMCKTHLR